jgi:hypothetical protein
LPNLVAVHAAVLGREGAFGMTESVFSGSQCPNYISCIFGDFRPSHLTKPEKSVITQLRDWWLVFPASIFSRITGQGNAPRPREVFVSLSLARVSVADVATEVRRPSAGYRSRPRAAQDMCSASLSQVSRFPLYGMRERRDGAEIRERTSPGTPPRNVMSVW